MPDIGPDQSKTVLIFEDDAAIQDLLFDVLSEEGYGVLQATDGTDGLSLAERHRPDAILLDLTLPPTSGLDVLASLKQGRTTRHIPVMMMSGRALPQDHRADVETFVAKPFDI